MNYKQYLIAFNVFCDDPIAWEIELFDQCMQRVFRDRSPTDSEMDACMAMLVRALERVERDR